MSSARGRRPGFVLVGQCTSRGSVSDRAGEIFDTSGTSLLAGLHHVALEIIYRVDGEPPQIAKFALGLGAACGHCGAAPSCAAVAAGGSGTAARPAKEMTGACTDPSVPRKNRQLYVADVVGNFHSLFEVEDELAEQRQVLSVALGEPA